MQISAASTNRQRGQTLALPTASGDAEKARELLTNTHAAGVTNGDGNIERRAGQARHDIN